MNMNASRNVIQWRPRRYDSSERVIEYMSECIMSSGRTYKEIALDVGVSANTIAKIARRETAWPRPHTLFALINYFNIELQLSARNR